MSNAIAIPVENNWSDAPIRVLAGQIGGIQANVCDARELHTYLRNRRQFSDWVKQRIEQYGFEENRDFHSFSLKSEKPRGGRPSTEYHLSIDMTKELGMVENNERGRRIRRYFIECEKRLREIAPSEADTILNATIGTNGFTMLGALIKGKVAKLPTAVRRRATAKIWSQTHAAFGVRSAADIPAEQLDAVRNFIAAYALDGEFLGKAPSDPDSLVLSPFEVACLYSLMSSYYRACKVMREDGLYRLAREVDSRPLFNMLEHLLYSYMFQFQTLEERLEEIYRLAKKGGSHGGYAAERFDNPLIR